MTHKNNPWIPLNVEVFGDGFYIPSEELQRIGHSKIIIKATIGESGLKAYYKLADSEDASDVTKNPGT